MKLYSENKNYKLFNGNMLDMLEVIDKESIDSIITDPPYELNFMNKGWDNSGIAFQVDTWKKCYEVLKPGGYLLAFGGSRTFHRIACAIEDAGFEIRDTIMWLYGSGFPKSMNLANGLESKIINGNANKTQFKKLDGEKAKPTSYSSFTKHNIEQGFRPKDYAKQDYEATVKVNYTTDLAKKWQGWGTALKPSFEPIIVARKPFKGSLVDNVIESGVGGINIDECRVGNKERFNPSATIGKDGIYNWNTTTNENKDYKGQIVNGRFPANTILTYDETDFDEVCGGFPNTKTGWKNTDITKSKENINVDFGVKIGMTGNHYEDSGSASRYFYCAKASKKDRDEGLDEFEEKNTMCDRDPKLASANMPQNRSGNLRKNTHPTVKPTELMQYLVRLVSPNGATILDPFNGSGSTGKAVMYENKERNKNYKYIGIELTEEYLPIAKARIEYVCKNDNSIDNLKENKKDVPEGQTNIFDFIGD